MNRIDAYEPEPHTPDHPATLRAWAALLDFLIAAEAAYSDHPECDCHACDQLTAFYGTIDFMTSYFLGMCVEDDAVKAKMRQLAAAQAARRQYEEAEDEEEADTPAVIACRCRRLPAMA